jgi:hypothetical protein
VERIHHLGDKWSHQSQDECCVLATIGCSLQVTEGDGMRVQELVGQRIKEARGDAMSQAHLGSEVARYLGKGWASKHAISQAENGHRPLNVEQLLVFAVVLEKPLSWFFLPDEAIIEIGGKVVPLDDLAKALVSVTRIETDELSEIAEAAAQVSGRLTRLAARIADEEAKVATGLSAEQLLRAAFGIDVGSSTPQPSETPPMPASRETTTTGG